MRRHRQSARPGARPGPAPLSRRDRGASQAPRRPRRQPAPGNLRTRGPAAMAWWIFQNVVVTAVLALLVALACRTGRIGPVGRHALWVLVLVKFVTPPL